MKGTVLVVEDSVVISIHIKKCLQSIGLKVIACVASGEEAIELMDKAVPDVILMDIKLEGELDGIETARRIKEKVEVPIIFLTAMNDKETLNRAKGVLPYAYISKPFVEKDLQTQVEITIFKAQKENELKESEEKFFTTVNCIESAIIIINKQFEVTYMNPAAERMTGYEFDMHKLKDLFDIFILRDIRTGEILGNPFTESIKGRSFHKGDSVYLQKKDGTYHPIGGVNYSTLYNFKRDITGMVVYFSDHTEKIAIEKARNEIERKKITSLIEGQEMERKRVSRELHDGLGQLLNALKINFELSNEEVESNYLKKAVGMLNEAINETRRISENLLPSRLNDFSLSDCLLSLCGDFSYRDSLQMKCDIEDVGDHVSDEVKIHLYRITQEAINNATKHSGAREMKISLKKIHNRIMLLISDNGCGLKKLKSDSEVHHGLQNMIDRVKIMQGKINMHSGREGGFNIQVEVPVKIHIHDKSYHSG